MEKLDELLSRLPERHRTALSWFLEHAGREEPWPLPLSDGTLVATRAKGIYKPNWTDYALSVRQALDGPYADREPVVRPDGSWSTCIFRKAKIQRSAMRHIRIAPSLSVRFTVFQSE